MWYSNRMFECAIQRAHLSDTIIYLKATIISGYILVVCCIWQVLIIALFK